MEEQNSIVAGLFQDGNLPQKVKVNGGEVGLNQSPETPDEMRRLDTGRESNRQTHRIKMDSLPGSKGRVSNYPTHLTRACTELAEALWQLQQKADKENNRPHRLAHPPHCHLFLLTVNKL